VKGLVIWGLIWRGAWNTRTMPPKNAVNEFDEDRWTNAFNQMTAEKVSVKDDGSNVREAAEMVRNIFNRMVRYRARNYAYR